MEAGSVSLCSRISGANIRKEYRSHSWRKKNAPTRRPKSAKRPAIDESCHSVVTFLAQEVGMVSQLLSRGGVTPRAGRDCTTGFLVALSIVAALAALPVPATAQVATGNIR